MMKKFNTSEFKEAFLELGLQEGDMLMIHSSLLKFGVPNDVNLEGLSEKIFKILLSVIGENGTMAVPTFNFEYCNGIIFNKQETPSKLMGVFSEYIRKLPESKRSFHPMQSITAVGEKAEFLNENDTVSAFSPEGPFDRLLALNTKVILLGTDLNSVSMIHWVEEKLKVPYRYWKSFSGIYVDDLISYQRSYKMFVRSLELNPKLNMCYIENQLIREKKIQIYNIGGSAIRSFNLNDFVSIAMRCLTSNPYFFVSNHPDFEKKNVIR